MVFVDGPQGLRVLVGCARAEAAGVRPGLPLAEARALLDGLVPLYFDHDPVADRDGLRQLARRCGRYSPFVACDPADDGFSEGLVLSADAASLFQGEPAWAARLGQDLVHRGYDLRGAVADTVGAAWALARYATRPVFGRRFILCPSGQHAERLAALPVTGLRLSGSAQVALAEVGVRTIGQVEALPRAALPSRFGQELLLRLDQAHGREPEPLTPESFASPPTARRRFEPPLIERQAVRTVVERLLAVVVRAMRPTGRGIGRISIELTGEDGATTLITVGFARPRATMAHIREVVFGRLDRSSLPQAVTSVRVRVREAGRLDERQRRIQVSDRSDDPSVAATPPVDRAREDVSELLDRLAGRLGESRVLTPGIYPDAQPERAVTTRASLSAEPSWPPPKTSRSRRSASPARRPAGPSPPLSPASSETDLAQLFVGGPPDAWDAATETDGLLDLPFRLPGRRPIRLLASPRPIRVQIVGDRPSTVTLTGRSQTVIAAVGPERIATGWWRERTVRRDYWRLTLSDGREVWVFFDPDESRWFWHGEFG